MPYPLLGVDMLEDLISVLSQARSEDDDLEDLRHLKQEYVQPESLGDVYLLCRPLHLHFDREVVSLCFLEGTVNEGLVEVEDECLPSVAGRGRQESLYLAFFTL